MATPVGTNEINSFSRRFIIKRVADNVYHSNTWFFRLNARNRVFIQGGYQIEYPVMWQRMAAGGAYQGYDLLDVTPSDTARNAAWDWKQYEVPVSIDRLSLIKSDSPEAVVNLLSYKFDNAEMELAELLGVGVWTNSTAQPKQIDGLPMVIDDGTNAATYAGLNRTTFPFWKSTVTAITPPLGLAAMQTMWGNCQDGGRVPTVLMGTQTTYNIYWNLNTSGQSFPVQPAAHDSQLAQSGFTNLLFNTVPFLVDSHATASEIQFINEDYFSLVINKDTNFELRDFQQPVNQDAYVGFILWAGNLICSNVGRQGRLTTVTS